MSSDHRETVAVEVPVELFDAVILLIAEWEKARTHQHVRQPVSYAMYNTWRKIEKEEMKRK